MGKILRYKLFHKSIHHKYGSNLGLQTSLEVHNHNQRLLRDERMMLIQQTATATDHVGTLL